MIKQISEDEEKKEHKLSVFWLVFTILSIVQAVVLFYVCRRLPEKVPVHFNFAMKIDRYGSPWELAVLGITTPLLFIIRRFIHFCSAEGHEINPADFL
jgi:uncharacterized membrane protein